MVVTYPFGGKADIYELNADSLWVLSQSILMNALWNESTAISGDGQTVAFANYQQGEVGIDIYLRNGSVWENLGDRIEVEGVGDKIALALSEDGTRLLYGVMHGDYVHNNAGYARVLEWDGIGWSQLGNDFYGGETPGISEMTSLFLVMDKSSPLRPLMMAQPAIIKAHAPVTHGMEINGINVETRSMVLRPMISSMAWTCLPTETD